VFRVVPAGADSPTDLTPELLVLSVPQRPTTSFFGRRPGPWPAPATGFSPKFVGQPSCGDVAIAVADPAPPGRESRSAETDSATLNPEYAAHRASLSSVSARWPHESPPHLLPRARVPAWPASAQTIAHSRWLPYPHALVGVVPRKISSPPRCHVLVGVRSLPPFLCPP